MSLANDLNKIDTDLKQVKTDTNKALSEKGSAGVSTLSELPLAIRNIPSSSYTLPVASADTLGGVKVGENLSITPEGVLSATGGGSALTIDTAETLFDETIDKPVKRYDRSLKNTKYTHILLLVYPVRGDMYAQKPQKVLLGGSAGGNTKTKQFNCYFDNITVDSPLAIEMYSNPESKLFRVGVDADYIDNGGAIGRSHMVDYVRADANFAEQWLPGTRFVIKGW